ncbi:hypothetical protein B0T25DRAFT_512032 [Lasiosphaeria hispida]|uniref:FAD-binding PCMH-type domain-containing protein n=1 Tax=Lasiosphaeria hispida TaxID=260671 RepID=A0AAJ0M7T5_9PEZI|nr:hypothetical protein B0T25DRAFT_512032 [Lasiosphaeria hispida]
MVRSSTALSALAVAVSTASATASQSCKLIENSVSDATAVSYPGFLNSPQFNVSTAHWFQSSSQRPTCVVEVGSVHDVSIALQVVGAQRTRFAVMSGGHASNQGFSSTDGVHIALNRFDQVILSADKKTVEIGFGIVWSDVFEKLEGTGVNVVGGRVEGPAVGGFTLGGGYSWKTNQYGLTVDTVVSYTLVLPDGTITQVTAKDTPDLSFALKGGMNRFGIVTSAVFRTHPQPPQVYGGFGIYPSTSVPAIIKATQKFHDQGTTDTKTQIITALVGTTLGTEALVMFFHDGPNKPALFKLFDGIPAILNTNRAWKFSKYVKSIPSDLAQLTNIRGAFATFSTSTLTPRFLEAIRNETEFFSGIMDEHGGITTNYDIEPFTNYGRFAVEGAYPHANSPLPLNLYFSWLHRTDDDFWHSQMRASIGRLQTVALGEGIYNTATLFQYPNYALANATSNELYGFENAARLRAIRDRIDPTRIMNLAGGFGI